MYYIEDAIKRLGRKIALNGWIHRKRESGGIVFIVLRDRTGTLQATIKKDTVDSASWKAAEDVAVEASVSLSGIIKREERSPSGYEIECESLRIIGGSEPFPITEYRSAELLLDKRHLWLRSQRMINIMRLRSSIFKHIRSFMDKNGFYEVTPPLITEAGGETGANLFELDYFGQKAYLTESSQLYVEAMVYSLEKVYSLAPSYRAEKSRTVKHLAEYWHLEPEMAHYDNKRSMKLQERLISHIAERLAKENEVLLSRIGVEKGTLLKIKPPFKRISYESAIELLNSRGIKKAWGDDLGAEDERAITKKEEKPLFIYNWPREIKPFYMPINPKDPRTVLCSDLQAPDGHGEIIGGSERIWKYEELMARIREVEKTSGVKLNLKNYEWWIDLRRYGSVPHAGFGLGVERLTKWLLNLEHIRDALPFPRMINRLRP